MRAGATAGGGELVGALTQADSSSVSAASISLGSEAGLVVGIGSLLELMGAAGFFGPRSGGVGKRFAPAVALGLSDGGARIGSGGSAPLPHSGQRGQQQGGEQRAHHSRPAYLADLASTSATWCRLMSHALRLP